VAAVAAQAADEDIALFIEPLSYSIDADVPRLVGEGRRRVVVETARRLSAIGGDVLKAEFPYDASVTDESRWREACEELDEASLLPWVLLSGGVDEETFERQVATACRAGASGVLVGRSVWAEAARLGPPERDAFLDTTGIGRLRRLVELVDRIGRPWHERPSSVASTPSPDEGWYHGY
jgi:tagatose-1,6-bisphosphate aldolase